MARADLINRLYSAHKTPLEFQFQSLMAPPLLSLLSPYDIKTLSDLARDPRLSAKLSKKLEIIKSILEPRGFIKFHSGTNRIVYRFLEDQSFLIKIALDKTGLGDNPMEYQNQFLLAPFVTKVFESTPCGTVGLFERVEPITSRQEFISIAEDVFDLINDKFIGEYVLEDIGTEYFMNWGIRRGFGPVLLDFPYCYKLDGNKLYCNKIDISNGVPCGGAIDYDNGFNNLICTKCGAKIFAKDLKMGIDTQNIILKGRREHSTMKVMIAIPGQQNQVKDTTVSAKTYADTVKQKKKTMEIAILNNKPILSPEEEIKRLVAQSQASRAKKAEEERQAQFDAEKAEDVEAETNEEEHVDRNVNKHEYVARQSAPYARPETPSYLDMNREEEEDGSDDTNMQESDSEEENGEEPGDIESDAQESESEEEIKEDEDGSDDTNMQESDSEEETKENVEPDKEKIDIPALKAALLRPSATVREQHSSRVVITPEKRVPRKDEIVLVDELADAGGKYPAKKQGRDDKGKFTKQK